MDLLQSVDRHVGRGGGNIPRHLDAAVTTWFDSNRGLALGITMMGTGLVAASGPLYAAWLIENFGWRDGYRAIGATLLVFSFPIAYLFFREKPVTVEAGPAPAARLGVSFRDALSDYRFWAMGIGLLFVCYGVAGLISTSCPCSPTGAIRRPTPLALPGLSA